MVQGHHDIGTNMIPYIFTNVNQQRVTLIVEAADIVQLAFELKMSHRQLCKVLVL